MGRPEGSGGRPGLDRRETGGKEERLPEGHGVVGESDMTIVRTPRESGFTSEGDDTTFDKTDK